MATRVEQALRRLGFTIQRAQNAAQALQLQKAHPAMVAVINFNEEALNAILLVKELKSQFPQTHILGFVSHTHLPLLRPQAREAGCDRLVANSALLAHLPQLLGWRQEALEKPESASFLPPEIEEEGT